MCLGEPAGFAKGTSKAAISESTQTLGILGLPVSIAAAGSPAEMSTAHTETSTATRICSFRLFRSIEPHERIEYSLIPSISIRSSDQESAKSTLLTHISHLQSTDWRRPTG